MKTKPQSITKSYEIKEILRKAKCTETPQAKLYCAHNNNAGLRTTIVVSKKTEKSAVKRNRIRRQVKNVFKNLGLEKTVDIIFIVKKGLIEQEYQHVQAAVQAGLKAARII